MAMSDGLMVWRRDGGKMEEKRDGGRFRGGGYTKAFILRLKIHGHGMNKVVLCTSKRMSHSA